MFKGNQSSLIQKGNIHVQKVAKCQAVFLAEYKKYGVSEPKILSIILALLQLGESSLHTLPHDFLLNSLAKAGSKVSLFFDSVPVLVLDASLLCALGIPEVLLLCGSTKVLVRMMELSPSFAPLPDMAGSCDASL